MAWAKDWALLCLIPIVRTFFDPWAMENILHKPSNCVHHFGEHLEHTGRFGG